MELNVDGRAKYQAIGHSSATHQVTFRGWMADLSIKHVVQWGNKLLRVLTKPQLVGGRGSLKTTTFVAQEITERAVGNGE